MNKELIIHSLNEQDDFTAELKRAADDILNHLSDEDLDRLLGDEDRTFLNQVTPDGTPLVSSVGESATMACAYSWGSFSLTTSACRVTSVTVTGHGMASGLAANRQDLALAA